MKEPIDDDCLILSGMEFQTVGAAKLCNCCSSLLEYVEEQTGRVLANTGSTGRRAVNVETGMLSMSTW